MTTTSSCFARSSERDVEGGRARVEGDRLAVPDHRGGSPGDRALRVLLDPEANVERGLRLSGLERPRATANASDKAPLRKNRKVVPDRDLGDLEVTSELRHRHGVTRVEQLEDPIHARCCA